MEWAVKKTNTPSKKDVKVTQDPLDKSQKGILALAELQKHMHATPVQE